eukprot:216191-Prorocentrum_minimum.AAC.1
MEASGPRRHVSPCLQPCTHLGVVREVVNGKGPGGGGGGGGGKGSFGGSHLAHHLPAEQRQCHHVTQQQQPPPWGSGQRTGQRTRRWTRP